MENKWRSVAGIIAFFVLVGSIIFYFIFQKIWILFISSVSATTLIFSYISTFLSKVTIKRINYLENRHKKWNEIAYRVDKAGEEAFNKIPIGIMIIEETNMGLEIFWANKYANDIFRIDTSVKLLNDINSNFCRLYESKENFKITIYEKTYKIINNYNEKTLYIFDISEYEALDKKYKDERVAIGIINIDNLIVSYTSLSAQERAKITGDIIDLLTNWANKYGMFLKGYAEDKFLIMFYSGNVDKIISNDFKIVDDIRNYGDSINLGITASIGIACLEGSVNDIYLEAQKALDQAMFRSGNQTVLNIDGKIMYHGAYMETFALVPNVEIRYNYETFINEIKKYNKVFVMSHTTQDVDGFASCLATYKLVKALGKEAYIVYDEKSYDSTVNDIFYTIKTEHKNMIDQYITPSNALKLIKNDTLLIIVDFQSIEQALSLSVIKKAKNIAIIDHHRGGSKTLNYYKFRYVKTTASSCVEMILEMFEFVNNVKIEISSQEATWMLMGILIDTNNLVYRVSSSTFKILAKLHTYGAIISKAQALLRENVSDFKERMKIIDETQIYKDTFAIVKIDKGVYDRSYLAKIADKLITIKGIKAAFAIATITEEKHMVGISARSLAEFNVQSLMEKMGGGGHFNNSATQIKNINVNDAYMLLISKIDEMIENEEEIMKVILLKDVKDHGRSGDIVEEKIGFANHLIREGKAIMATTDNVKELETRKNKQAQEDANHFEQMKLLKLEIESKPINIYVKTGKDGKLFGSVSTKQVVDEYENIYKIKLDKKKLTCDKIMNSLNSYIVNVLLHKDVKAKLVVNIYDKDYSHE